MRRTDDVGLWLPHLEVEMCMGMGTIIGIPWVQWESHGNVGDNDYIMGIQLGVHGNESMRMGIELWEREWIPTAAFRSIMKICSIIREPAKPSRFILTLARPSPEHVISSSHTLDRLSSEWCVLILTKIIHCLFSVNYYKTFLQLFVFQWEWKLLFGNKLELDCSLRFPKAGNRNGNEVMGMGGNGYTKVIAAHLHLGGHGACGINSTGVQHRCKKRDKKIKNVKKRKKRDKNKKTFVNVE